jgi:TolA-binding protein
MKRYPQTGYRASALFWLGNAPSTRFAITAMQ